YDSRSGRYDSGMRTGRGDSWKTPEMSGSTMRGHAIRVESAPESADRSTTAALPSREGTTCVSVAGRVIVSSFIGDPRSSSPTLRKSDRAARVAGKADRRSGGGLGLRPGDPVARTGARP